MQNNPMQAFQQMMANPGQMQQRFQKFQQGFQGDPQQQVQQMLQSGQISQQQYSMAQQMARMLMQTFGIK